MPLVTRSSVSGRIFKQSLEPTDWLDGDLWVDTDTSILSVNNSGTAEAVLDQVLDAQRSAHTIAGSIGEFYEEMMDAAIASDNFAESGMDVTRRLSAETMGSVTTGSLMDKLTGMTSNQAVATSGATITDSSTRNSAAEDITTTLTPTAAGISFWYVFTETLAATIAIVEVSADSGTTFIDPSYNLASLSTFGGGTTSPVMTLGATDRFRWTNPGTTGTYIVDVAGSSLS